MPIATTTITSTYHHHHHQQRQVIACAGAQLMAMAALLLELRILVDISGACYLLSGVRRNTYLCIRAYIQM